MKACRLGICVIRQVPDNLHPRANVVRVRGDADGAEGMGIVRSGADHDFLVSLFGAIAHFEGRLVSGRTKDGLRTAGNAVARPVSRRFMPKRFRHRGNSWITARP